MNLRQTHTFVTLELTKSSFIEIRDKLAKAGYHLTHFRAEHDGMYIDMNGISVKEEDEN